MIRYVTPPVTKKVGYFPEIMMDDWRKQYPSGLTT